jgi:hypothetical protein
MIFKLIFSPYVFQKISEEHWKNGNRITLRIFISQRTISPWTITSEKCKSGKCIFGEILYSGKRSTGIWTAGKFNTGKWPAENWSLTRRNVPNWKKFTKIACLVHLKWLKSTKNWKKTNLWCKIWAVILNRPNGAVVMTTDC